MNSPSLDSGGTVQPEVFTQPVNQVADSNTTNVAMTYTDRTAPHLNVPMTKCIAPAVATSQGHSSVGCTKIVNNALLPRRH
jgi:hypothetical protein